MATRKKPDKAGTGAGKPPPPEDGLFEKVMQTVAPLPAKRRNRIAGPAEAKNPDKPETAKQQKKPSPKATAKPVRPVSRSKPEPAPANTGMDKRQASRFRRGQLPIEATLDLHGDTQAVAHGRLRQFIHSAHGRGLRCVLVITGKGLLRQQRPGSQQHGSQQHGSGRDDDFALRQPEAGVLRRNLPLWLAAVDLAPMVLSHSAAQPKDGGSGAFYVLLRRRREAK